MKICLLLESNTITKFRIKYFIDGGVYFVNEKN